MTRQDFIDGITTWAELLDFCYNEECDICEDIVSNDTMCEEIDDDLREGHSLSLLAERARPAE